MMLARRQDDESIFLDHFLLGVLYLYNRVVGETRFLAPWRVLENMYERLLQNGKKPMVAMSAVMRKMIVILNAKIRDAEAA